MARVVFVNRYFHPDESATSQLLTDLARHVAGKHDVVVLASRQLLEDPRRRLRTDDTLDRVRIRRLWSTSFGRGDLAGRALDYLSFLASVALWLLLQARRGDVIVAKTDPPVLGAVTTLATLGRGVRRVQWLQDLFPETAERLGVVRDRGWLANGTRTLRDWSLRHTGTIVVPSAGMRTFLADRLDPSRVVHIPNWADDVAPAAAPPHPGGPLTVGYAGNLGRAHPIDALLQIARGPEDPSLRFVFTGGGAHYDRLRREVLELGRRNWSFGPYVPRPELPALLRRPDVHLVLFDPRVERFVFPSKVYGILAAGRPIVLLGDTEGEVAGLLREHACGWTLPPDAGAPLLGLLRELQQQPQRLSQAARGARLAYEATGRKSQALARWDAVLGTAAGRRV